MDKKYTVLIVDDAEQNIELMSEMLKDSYNIITADNGALALEIMRGEARPDDTCCGHNVRQRARRAGSRLRTGRGGFRVARGRYERRAPPRKERFEIMRTR